MTQDLHVTIRTFRETDWEKVWGIIRPVFAEGEYYMFDPDINQDEAYKAWITAPKETFVAVDSNGDPIATYYIKPNQPTLGAHICNCGYIVSESARGKGLARSLCEHSCIQAKKMGFRGMQFNAVVSTNTVAVNLWLSLGFKKIGVIPDGFRSRKFGYVDILIMYQGCETPPHIVASSIDREQHAETD